MSATSIQSRWDLFDVSQHTIEGTYDELVDEQDLKPGQTMLKTFIIESNVTPKQLQQQMDVTKTRGVDFNLYELIIQRNGTTHTFFIGSNDSRFWTL